MNKFPAVIAVAIAVVSTNGLSGASANQSPIDRFLGEYRGVSVEDPDKTWSPTDLNVSIRSHDEGFVMSWKTVTKPTTGPAERQDNVVRFHQTKRHNIYAAAMRPNLFGGWVPLDPFSGDPFMWARILDSTLTVYSMTITSMGAHDMQIYERTLIPGGLSLHYTRLRDEAPLENLHGTLKRVK